MGAQELPLVMDRLTTNSGSVLPNVLNVNTASAEVLSLMPQMDANLAQRIVDARGALEASELKNISWLYTQNIVSADVYKAIAPQLTTRSRQFRIMCIGFGSPCERFRVLEAVVDLADSTPRILYLRDLTKLGLPLEIDLSQEMITR